MRKRSFLPLMSMPWARQLFILLTVMMLGLPMQANAQETYSEVLTVYSQDDWNKYAEESKFTKSDVLVKLETDLNFDQNTQLGHFDATLDGQGHSFIVNYTGSLRKSAPIEYLTGTVRNLNLKGYMEYKRGTLSSYQSPSPLAEYINGNTLIENCHSSVTFKQTGTAWLFGINQAFVGGFVGKIYLTHNNQDVSVTFKDCSFTGKIIDSGDLDWFGSFVGYNDFANHYYDWLTMNFENCYVDLSKSEIHDVTKHNDLFFNVYDAEENIKVNSSNCYALGAGSHKFNNSANATTVTEEQLKSGELAYKLAAGRTGSDNPWRQTIGTDNVPTDAVRSPNSKEVFYSDVSTRDITNDKWTTLFYPFNVTLPDNVKKYIVTGVKDGKVSLSELNTTTTANVPMLLYSESGFQYIKLPELYYNKTEQNATLRGAYNSVAKNEGDYVLDAASGKFVPAKDNLIQWHCYLAGGTGDSYELDTSNADYYVISSKESWNTFKKAYSDIEVKVYLDCDLTLTADDVAMENFKGTFDGQGHSIIYDFNDLSTTHDVDHSDGTIYGFMKYAEGTIRNLNITGTIKTKCRFVGGPLAWANFYGALNVENCHSDVNFCTTYSDLKYTFGSGFIASTGNDATFTDCSFTGSFTSEKLPYTGGFVGEMWYESNVTFTNCYSNIHTGTSSAIYSEASAGYFVGTMQARGTYTCTNCYAHNSSELDFSAYSDGVIIPTDEQIKSGEVTFALNNWRDDMAWAQTIGTDSDPQVKATSPKSYDVKQAKGTISKNADAHWTTLYYPADVTFAKNQGIDIYDAFATNDDGGLLIYENLSGTLKAGTPALLYAENGFTEDITLPMHFYNEEALTSGSNYLFGTKTDTDAASLYLLGHATEGTPTFAAPTGSTTLPTWQCYTTQPFSTVSLDGSIIYSKEDWNTFKTKYNNKKQGFARLACDLTLTDDDAPMEKFVGTFDGQGHTITVNYSNTSNKTARAPFYSASGTIRNLNINGTITHAAYNAPLACCIIEGETLNVENCHSSVTHTRLASDTESSKFGTGFISYVGITPTSYIDRDGCCVNFKDCSFTGGFKALDTENDKTMWFAGFVTNLRSKNSVNFENCLSTISSTAAIDVTNRSDYFVPFSDGTITSKNCYAQQSFIGKGDNRVEYTNTANVTVLTPEEMKSGKVAYLLNAGRTGNDAVWMQTIGTDTVPMPKTFSTNSREVYLASDTVNIEANGWATIYYPVAHALPQGVKAYTVSGVDKASKSSESSETPNYVVQLIELTDTIPAYTPVLLSTLKDVAAVNKSATTIVLPSYYYNELDTMRIADYTQKFQLFGVSDSVESANGYYVLDTRTDADGSAKTAFYRVDRSVEEYSIPAWQCVLVYTGNEAEGEEGASNANVIYLREDDIATAINTAKAATDGISGNGRTYDVEGRAVKQLRKGNVYIKNGKKFIVK